ncbi:hypothetical protein RND71_006145 [Anisodus tanguticus]|uniref:SAM domain-containing protein n=1 Tax=Anisodus tanguticus TaxID=243964 RepID=A0AAE1STR2_9SOLA|nr:hypothetical protein RND71_006145 [Anisodus tanguticus]
MDWFSWLSKTELEPSLVYEYGLAFAHNELEQDDIAYFNHEFLQSMGICIAKHRLEILKLAKKERGNVPNSMSKVLLVIKRTKKRFSKYFRTWIRREESALALVSRRSYSSRVWKRTKMLKKNNSVVAPARQNSTLLLTNGSPIIMSSSSRINSFSSPMVHDLRGDEKMEVDYGDYWGSFAVEEIRWDSMFQNLKPT